MSQNDIDSSRAPLLSHLIELRSRLIWALVALVVCVAICFPLAGHIFNILSQPLKNAFLAKCAAEGIEASLCLAARQFQFTAVTEAFFTHMKIALFGGLFISFPIIAGQLWRFVAPGLYKNERRAFLPFLIATPVLFCLGALLLYYLVMPLVMKFFISYESSVTGELGTQLIPKMNEYLNTVMTLIFAFGLAFQLPVLLVLLARAGLVSSGFLARNRKYAVVVVFAFSALITPPDIFSQIGLGLPMILLYEISIWAIRFNERRDARATEAEDGAGTAA